ALCALILCMSFLPAVSETADAPLRVTDGVYREGEYLYRVLADDTAEIVSYMGDCRLEIREIASSLGGHPVSAIGDRAFSNEGWIEFYTDEYPDYQRESIRRLTVPEGVTRIGAYAFEYCFNLIEITLPSTLLEIGEGAFDQCTTLSRVSLPSGLRALGSLAFHDCTSIIRMALPDSLTAIGENPFAGCTHLQTIGVSATHPFLRYEAGFLYDRDQLKLITVTREAQMQNISLSLFLIPGLREIGPYAFEDTPVTAITLPDTVTAVGSFAFADCMELRSLTLPASVETLGDNPVRGCKALADLTLPENGRFAIREEALIDEQEGRLIASFIPATERAYNAYTDRSANLPETMQAYGQTLHLVEAPPSGWFEDAEEESIRAAYTVPDGITTIGAGAFDGVDVQKIYLTDSVHTLGEGAFRRCEFLEVCRIPDAVTVFPDELFDKCTALKVVSIPSGLERIGAYALAETKIDRMILPDSVTEIGRYAFKNMNSGWNAQTEVRLSRGLTAIPKGAFCGSSILAIDIPNSVTEIGQEAFARTNRLESVRLPEKLSAIADFCFFDSGLQSIAFPHGLQYIGDSAFRIDDYHGGSLLGAIEIPDTVKYLGRSAFRNQSELTNVSLPGSVALGDSVFYVCRNLKTVELADGITAIPAEAFEYTALEMIRIPDTVSFIGNCAFGRTNLAEISLPAGKVTFDGNPFAESPLKRVNIDLFHPNLRLQGNLLIDADTRTLVSYIPITAETACQIPEGIEAIAPYACCQCEFESVTLPSTLKRIDDYAFFSCNQVTDIQLPEGLERIGKNALYNLNWNIASLRLPGTLRFLGAEALYNYNSIEEIIVPASVSFIGLHALNAKRVVFESAPLTLEGNPFVEKTEEIILSADHPTLELVDGNVYEKQTRRLIAQRNFTPMREGTLEIAMSALNYYHTNEDALAVPESVERIDLYGSNRYYENYPRIYAVPGSFSEAFFDSVYRMTFAR
ncbi:MAG: leucine-rich repeat domain-containing protein, partial [Clostridia bacterium]|nr:leucine-rich repeat domain-containing protein [Clostridia bacterium]